MQMPCLPSSIYSDRSANIASFPDFYSLSCQWRLRWFFFKILFTIFGFLQQKRVSHNPIVHGDLELTTSSRRKKKKKSPPTLTQKLKRKNTKALHSCGGLSYKDNINLDIHKSNSSAGKSSRKNCFLKVIAMKLLCIELH